MNLTGDQRTERLPHGRIVVDRPEIDASSALPLTVLDADSYEPLASMAQEISRELGGDGLLVTWHEDAGAPQHLFVDGVCETGSAMTSGMAEMGASAAKVRGSGARSSWRTLSDDPSSGVLTTSIPAGRGVLTVVTVFRRIGRSTRMRAGESAARLMPFVQPFFRTWISRLRAIATLRALTTVVNDSDVGVLLLDHAGELLFANSTAEALLTRGEGVRRRGTMIGASSLADTALLHAAIEHALIPTTAKEGRPDQFFVALRRRNGRPLMAAVVPSDDQNATGSDCAAIVYIVDPDQDLQGIIQPMCDFYRLSRGEMRLASLLVLGRSLGEAADQMKIREQTARTYLKQVFLKTETNRQVDLVRLLLLGATRTGAGQRTPIG